MDSYTLKSVSDLPAPFRFLYGFRYFNSLQSECFPVCFHSDVSMVISAPTGSGKTVLFELCMLRLLSRFITEDFKFNHAKGSLKTIYVAPSKALVQEKLRDWSQKFGALGINCLELTGDNDFYNVQDIQDADIILTTPEKFDAVTRYRMKNGGLSFFSDIALLLIDEVHLLNDPRGAALEAIVSRMKMLSRNPDLKLSPLASVRLLAVSATIPNVEDLAEWLMVPVQGIKRFGEEMRPVKLTTRIIGYAPAKNDFLFEQRLQNFIFDVLMQFSKGKSALVFCSTRKGAQEAAQKLSQTAMTFGYSNPFIKDKEQQERLREASLSCSDKQMQSCIPFGVGYHHGGLGLKDRNLIEGLFLKRDVQILCTTNTLAHGINLPAHTVVIKSTRNYNKEKGLYMEYDRSTILQMCGRAGRPPFENEGMVIIMTRKETVHLYENLLSGCELVQSQMLNFLTEHLTAEIVQMTITDISLAIEWMKCSFLYIRMKKDPGSYAISKGITNNQIERHMREICLQKVTELSQHQMIWTDEDGFTLKPLEPGCLMTKYYLRFDTMKHILQLSETCSLEDALHIICHAEELAWIQLRRNEKKLLNDINADRDGRLRFHINGDKGKPKKRIQTRQEKIFILINDLLTGDPLVHDLSMTQEINSICLNGCRVAKCSRDYFLYKKNYCGVINSSLLAKSLHQKLWDISKYLLKQLPGVGMVTAKALHSMGVDSFEKLAEADPRRIEIVSGRKYPFGNQLKDSLQTLPPKVEMKAEEIECKGLGKAKVLVTLTRLTLPTVSQKRCYADLVVASQDDNLIHFHEKIRLDEFRSPYTAKVIIPCPRQGKLTVKADLIFDEYLGLDLHQSLDLLDKTVSDSGKQRFSFLTRTVEGSTLEDPNRSDTLTNKIANLRQLRKNSLSPSFKLLDEDSGDEKVTPIKVGNDEDLVISRSNVFDHIREKSKCFPDLSTSHMPSAPSAETMDIKRKRNRERLPDIHEIVEIEGGVTSSQPTLEPTTKQQRADESAVSLELEEASADVVLTESNDISVQANHPNTETVFDRIRKKFDNHQVNNSDISEPKPSVRNVSSLEQLTIITSDKTRPDHSSEMSRTPLTASPIQMLSFDISMAKERRPQVDNSRAADIVKNRRCSPKVLGSDRALSSTVTVVRKEADPFVGFQSVFSFL
ncbi:hypothetical protein MLD38_022679 [Melastoma candidum]|uniref:Uncharacterized protein n=1 Tax=Melastoma candidum TaxID=119954 RepID=A0ACB9QLW7_9MYRT|nr:hypothetical protein MLD38_022679 [Melastoma candidum]